MEDEPIGKTGDTSDVSAHIGLSALGLQLGTDVTPVEVGNSPARFSALLGGQVGGAIEDAIAYGPPAQQNGLHVLIDLQAQHIPSMGGALMIGRDYGASNPHAVEDVLKALVDAVRFFADDTNKQASLQAIGTILQLPVDDPQVLSTYDAYHTKDAVDPEPTPAAMQTMLGALQAIDPARFQNRTIDQFIDPSYTDALRQQGFVQGS